MFGEGMAIARELLAELRELVRELRRLSDEVALLRGSIDGDPHEGLELRQHG